MTQTSAPWDGILTGDAADSPYSADEWAHYWAQLAGAGSIFPNYGILPGTGEGTYDTLQVLATDPASTNVEVHPGAALVNGKLYENDAAETLAVAANASGNPRIDTVILRVDYTAQTVRLIVKQGTPAGSPARPALTQSASTWEIPLADIAVANGFSSITNANITDRRRGIHSTVSGWQPYAYPLSYISNGAYSSSAVAPDGLAFPIAITGNMLVHQLALRSSTTGNVSINWGVYVEDVNDQGTNDALVRFMGGRFDPSSIAVTSGTNAVSPADNPFYLPPGLYWLILDLSSLTMPTITPSTFEGSSVTGMFKSPFVLDQTVDLTDAWTVDNTSYAARLEGAVFGQATVFS